MALRAPALLGLLLVLASCGDDAAEPTTTEAPTTVATTTGETSTTEAATTTAPTTTAAPTTAATTTTEDIFYAILDTGPPPVFGAPGDPHGSGCVVPPGDVLPDGVWFGFAEAYSGGVISLDLACYFTGDAATAARIEDGLPGESDFSEYVRNHNPRTYQVRLAASAEVYSIPAGEGFPVLISAASWPNPTGYFDCPGENCPVWLYVNDGIVTGLVEQYFE